MFFQSRNQGDNEKSRVHGFIPGFFIEITKYLFDLVMGFRENEPGACHYLTKECC
jgi:hypothetical protein